MKRIVTIQDFSCVGKCSLTSALPVISAAGVEACGIPTALLSNHTGFDSFYSRDLTEELVPIGAQLKRENIGFDAIYTGYIASVHQMELISEFIDSFGGKDVLVFVDPVMGDNGRIYSGLSADHAQHFRKLCRKADIIAPNITEACLLLDREYSPEISRGGVEDMLIQLNKLYGGYVFITGVRDGDKLGAVGYDGSSFHGHFAPREDIVIAGTGDIFSAAFLGAVMRGADYARALDIAVDFTYEAVRCTVEAPDKRHYGVHFELALPYLIKEIGSIENNV